MFEGLEQTLNNFTEETEDIEEIEDKEAINVIKEITLNVQDLHIERLTQSVEEILLPVEKYTNLKATRYKFIG